MPSRIGKIINRKYKLTRVIGEGGMGTVYEAAHQLISRNVAIKVMGEEFSTNREVMERFLREAQSSSSIGHPNIIEIEDVGQEPDGTVYIVMELLQGQTLKELLAEEGKLSAGHAISIILQVLSALKGAHEKGIVHRDLKPDNLFISTTKQGRKEIKLLDFGIAKVQSDLEGDQGLTKTGTVLGTPNYMSPEQARGKPVDERIDIWAVGVILYEMLSGRRPYGGESYNEVLSDILLETPRPLGELTDGDSLSLAPLVEKAMKKDRDERYQNVSEMVEDLREFTHLAMATENMVDSTQKAIRHSIPPGAKENVFVQNRKRSKVRSLLVFLLVILSGGVAAMFYMDQMQENKDSLGEAVAFVDTTIQKAKEKMPELPVVKNDSDQDTDTATEADTSSDSAPLPDEVTITLTGVGKKAKLTIDGKKVKPPITLKGSTDPVTLKIVTKKNKPYTTEIVPDTDQELEVELELKPRFQKRGKK